MKTQKKKAKTKKQQSVSIGLDVYCAAAVRARPGRDVSAVVTGLLGRYFNLVEQDPISITIDQWNQSLAAVRESHGGMIAVDSHSEEWLSPIDILRIWDAADVYLAAEARGEKPKVPEFVFYEPVEDVLHEN